MTLLLLLPALAITVLNPLVELPLNPVLVGIFLLIELALVVMLLRRALSLPPPFRRGWLLVFLALTFLMAAATFWSLAPIAANPGLPEAFYFGAVLLIWAATLSLQSATRTRRRTGHSRLWLLDLLVVIISCATVSWYFLISPDQQLAGNATTFSQLMPLMDITLLALSAWLVLRTSASYPRPLFALAILLGVFSNTSLHLVVESVLPANSVGPFLWLLSTALMVVEAHRPMPPTDRRTAPRSSREQPWASLLPYIGVSVIVGLLINESALAAVEFRSEILNNVTLVAFGLLILRQLLTLAENRRLTDSLLRANAELSYRAYHDELTGLPNRAAFERQSREAFEQGSLTGVMFLDLDGFKAVNDELGHDAGDDLLKQLAGRLARAVPAGATVSRLGGDEFLIHFVDVPMNRDIAAGIKAAAEVPYMIDGELRRITVSIGLSDKAIEAGPAQMRHQADLAMYLAKQHAKAERA